MLQPSTVVTLTLCRDSALPENIVVCSPGLCTCASYGNCDKHWLLACCKVVCPVTGQTRRNTCSLQVQLWQILEPPTMGTAANRKATVYMWGEQLPWCRYTHIVRKLVCKLLRKSIGRQWCMQMLNHHCTQGLYCVVVSSLSAHKTQCWWCSSFDKWDVHAVDEAYKLVNEECCMDKPWSRLTNTYRMSTSA